MRQTISLRQSVFDQIAEDAREKRISPARLMAQAIEEYVQHQQNKRMQQQLDEAYADGPTEEERAYQRAAFESYCRLVAKEAQEDKW
jgi:hypothetical protein